MRILTAELETPRLVSVTGGPSTPDGVVVTLSWQSVEDHRFFQETEIYCRKVGDTDWSLSAIAPSPQTTTSTTFLDSQNAVPLVAGQAYEFRVQNYAPTCPIVEGDSPFSNVMPVQL